MYRQSEKKLVKQQYLLYMSLQYGELWPSSGWDRFVSLGHPCKFQLVSRLGIVTARHSSSGRQPNFAALNKGRHLCSAGRPSRFALAHILVLIMLFIWWLVSIAILLFCGFFDYFRVSCVLWWLYNVHCVSGKWGRNWNPFKHNVPQQKPTLF